MSRPCTPSALALAEQAELNKLISAPRTQRRHADRARIVLEAFHGKSNIEIAALRRTRPATLSKWRIRFEREGLIRLRDDFRPRRPRTQEDAENLRRRILECIDTPPPFGYGKWSTRTLGEVLEISPNLVVSSVERY